MTTFTEQVREAYRGDFRSLTDLKPHREVIYYLFRKHLGMNPEEVDELESDRVNAWLALLGEDQIQEKEKHKSLIQAIANIYGGKVK